MATRIAAGAASVAALASLGLGVLVPHGDAATGSRAASTSASTIPLDVAAVKRFAAEDKAAQRAALIAKQKDLVKRGLRRKPGTVYRANKRTVCRVYLLSRDCWTQLSPREKRRIAAKRARHARYLARKRAVAQRARMIREGRLVRVGTQGPIVPVPGFPGERAAQSILGNISVIVAKTGVRVTDCYGQGHASPGHTQTGTACDFGGSNASMDAAVRLTAGQGFTVLYDGRFGSQAASGHGPSYVAGGNAHLHVEFNRSW